MADRDETFYSERNLPVPATEYHPENAAQLHEVLTEHPRDHQRILIGNGHTVRLTDREDHSYDAIRTVDCNQLLTVDPKSKLARCEAGIQWGDFQRQVREAGISLSKYRLYPSSSTLGGLLARRAERVSETSTELRRGCVELRATSRATGEYHYKTATIKATGPDFRYLYLTSEGETGGITEATIRGWSQLPGRLLESKIDCADDAAELFSQIANLGIDLSWSHWSRQEALFSAGLHRPSQILEAELDAIRKETSYELRVRSRNALRQRRRQLESKHPANRSHPEHGRRMKAVVAPADAQALIDALDWVRDVVIPHWTMYTIPVYLTFETRDGLETAAPVARERALTISSNGLEVSEKTAYCKRRLKRELGRDHQFLRYIGQ